MHALHFLFSCNYAFPYLSLGKLLGYIIKSLCEIFNYLKEKLLTQDTLPLFWCNFSVLQHVWSVINQQA